MEDYWGQGTNGAADSAVGSAAAAATEDIDMVE
jgi:hypothetical protein